MKIYIDTRETDRVRVAVGERMVEREGRAQNVLGIIDEMLIREGKTMKEVSEVEIEVGPGSFTGLRVGMAIANTLGWCLGVPVNGRDVEKDGGVEPVYGPASFEVKK